MEFFMVIKSSLFSFLTFSQLTVVPILLCLKYRFFKQVNLFYFLLSMLVFLMLDVMSYTILVIFYHNVSTNFTINGDSIGILLVVSLITLLLYAKKIPIYQAIINTSGIYLIVLFVSTIFFSNVTIDINKPLGYIVSLSMITFFSFFLCFFFFKLLDKMNDIITNHKYYLFLSVCMIALIIIINLKSLIFQPENYQAGDGLNDMILSSSKKIPMDTFVGGTVLILLIVLIIVSNNYFKNQKIRLQTQQTKELKNYIETIEMIRDEVLSYQHDYDNIFSGISGYIYEEQIDVNKLRNYYEQSTEKIFRNEGIKIIKLLNLKNIEIPEIKGVLSQKILQARQKDIYVQLEAVNPITELAIDKIDLTRCLGILLDNAIEASSVSDSKQLSIAFITFERQVVISIKNSINSNQVTAYKNERGKRFSSKKESKKHGFGLLNINEILGKYENIQLKTIILVDSFVQEIRIKEVG